MRRSLALLALLLALAAAPAVAQTSPAELVVDRPAATLLLPYFEVDLGTATGRNTLFTVNNASATAALAHVTLWSDLSVPVLAFNVYLTGYDTQAFNMRSILGGTIPRTASDGQDPAGTISPQGILSQDINFASCSGILPTPKLGPGYVTHLANSLTGKFSSYLGGCAGLDHGDRIARGYVTVDTVNNCTLRVPGDPGYFVNGGFGDATNQNLLWGEFLYLTPPATATGATLSQGGALVGVHAFPGIGDSVEPAEAETTVAGQYTFYGRYVAWTAADNRQPLGSTFGVRYFTGAAPLKTKTQLVVWRDPKVDQGVFACGTTPAWYPLSQEQFTVFDEAEEPVIPARPPVFPPPPTPTLAPFPAATQRVSIGTSSLPVPYASGWLHLNLNTSVAVAGANPPEDPLAAQAWVFAIQDPRGRFNAGFRAATLESAAETTHVLLPY